MARKYLTDLDLANNYLNNAAIQVLASDPSSPVAGQVYFNSASKKLRQYDGTTWVEYGTGAGSGDVSSNTSTSVDGEAAVFSGTGGKTIKRFGGTGVVKASSGVLSASGIVTSDFAANVIDTDSTLAADSDTRIPTQKAVKAAIATAVTGLLDFKGSTDASSNPNYPAASKGDTYVVTVAGKIGGASGVSVDVGDMYFATADNAGGTQASVGASWSVLEHNLAGALLSGNNLSDVANAATAFSNIKQAATTTATGVVELATDAETTAKTDTTRAVTPSNLSSFTRKYTATIGDGSTTAIGVTHGLGSQYVTAQVFDATSNLQVECDVTLTSGTVTTFTFATAPTTNQYRVVIVG